MTRAEGSRLRFLLLGRLFNRPGLLAALSRLLARAGVPIACSPEELLAVCRRTDDFSNRAHAGNLIAGDFVIGMDSGPRQRQERAAVAGRLPESSAFGALASAEARVRVERIEESLKRGKSFDLIDDYLAFVAWSGLRGVFDCRAAASIEGVPVEVAPRAPDAALSALFTELRHVGGHLVVGGVAPRTVQVRAQLCADALNRRVQRSLHLIRAAWEPACPYAAHTAQRQAVGLMWVGHPAMVQAGALIFQELQSRPDAYRVLRELVAGGAGPDCGAEPFVNEALRSEVRGHVLECMRLRPPFPFLSRLLPREADLQWGSKGRTRTIAAGKSVYLSIAAGLRSRTDYDPLRALEAWRNDPDDLPIFGAGARACVAGKQVVELLVSALIGLLSLPRLDLADTGHRRIVYDGPILTRMRLKAMDTAAA